MQPGYPPPGQDPYGQQPQSQDPYGQQHPYQDPYSQPQYGQQPPAQYGDPNAQPPAYQSPAYQDPYAAPSAPTSGNPYPTSPPGYPSSPAGYPAQPPYSAPGYGTPPPQQNNTLGIVSLVLGILSLPFAFCCSFLGFPMGIAGAITGFLGMKKANEGMASNRGMALAGLICGAIGTVLSLVMMIRFFTGVASYDWSNFSG